MTIHLEELPQLDAVVAAAEAVGAERYVAPRNLAADLVGGRSHVVGRGHDGAAWPFERRFDVALARGLVG
jgi:hypothetical protein